MSDGCRIGSFAVIKYAHSKINEPKDNWQPLEDHLEEVAKLASSFADTFNASEWAYLAGLWHDIGKYSKEFQSYISQNDPDAHIETKPGKVDHSSAGAQHAFKSCGKQYGKVIAYMIAGHHGGLINGLDNEQSCLSKRLDKPIKDWSNCPESLKETFKEVELVIPFKLDSDRKRAGFQISFFIRMLYSCLVDADFLDTEEFMNSEKAGYRKGYLSIEELNDKLTEHLQQFESADNSDVNIQRAGVLANCLEAATLERGLFSLTVPTGGGKTLSSLAFALKHALKHGMKRVIYVIPYTSIIEQNAQIFRDALGENSVLEHHSNFEPKEEDHRSRLASENWDAPLVVTTNVQFFESLFARKSSRCRKLHNIANSVVILDEAQMLPLRLLKPCLEALKELSENYNTSVVLCTATQPALSTDDFKNGLSGVREIVHEKEKLYTALKRVEVTNLSRLTDDELSERLITHEQVLCIVNTRKHAKELYEKINDAENAYHLSALMCPQHRSEKLTEIKGLLKDEKPCRLVSTQLIEAGVDIDFPVVYRSIVGIDSIAQAAGRCNREGKLNEKGQVFVFMPEKGLPAGDFRLNAQISEVLLKNYDDPLVIEVVREYFKELYWTKDDKLDEKQILADLSESVGEINFPFRTVAEKFKLIDSITESVIIPYNNEAEKLIGSLKYLEYKSSFARKLQRYTVQLYKRDFEILCKGGAIEIHAEQFNILVNTDIYSKELGLRLDDPTFRKIGNMFV